MSSKLNSFPTTVKVRSNEWTLWWDDGSKNFEAKREAKITTPQGNTTLKLSVRFNSATPESGEGRVKVAMKNSLRRLALRIADSNLPAIVGANGGSGLLCSFNPKARFAAACEIVGC